MIEPASVTEIGNFGKTHGVDGEINLVLDPGMDVDPEALRCIIVDIDGILVPFFFSSVRRRGAQGYIVKIDGYDKQEDVAFMQGKDVMALKDELPWDEDDDEEGFYANDIIGFKALDTDGRLLGEVTDVDDSTANVLFVITKPDGTTFYVPVAEDFIDEIDADNKSITFSLPQGWPGL